MPNHNLPEVATDANKNHIDALLDEALAETFPASDPISVTLEKRDPENPQFAALTQIETKMR